jgi:hypothetical protein
MGVIPSLSTLEINVLRPVPVLYVLSVLLVLSVLGRPPLRIVPMVTSPIRLLVRQHFLPVDFPVDFAFDTTLPCLA